MDISFDEQVEQRFQKSFWIPPDVKQALEESSEYLQSIEKSIRHIAHTQNVVAIQENLAPSCQEAAMLFRSLLAELQEARDEIRKLASIVVEIS